MTVVRAWVGVTDDDWYRFLAARPTVTEVDFWQPSGGHEFHVLAPGEPFFFKTHYPHNKVVGGGFFSDSARLRVSEAWDLFGQANGADSIEQMRTRIGCAPRHENGRSFDSAAPLKTWPTLRAHLTRCGTSTTSPGRLS